MPFFFMHLNNSLWSSNEFVLHIRISLPVPAMKGRMGSAEKLQHLTSPNRVQIKYQHRRCHPDTQTGSHTSCNVLISTPSP